MGWRAAPARRTRARAASRGPSSSLLLRAGPENAWHGATVRAYETHEPHVSTTDITGPAPTSATSGPGPQRSAAQPGEARSGQVGEGDVGIGEPVPVDDGAVADEPLDVVDGVPDVDVHARE